MKETNDVSNSGIFPETRMTDDCPTGELWKSGDQFCVQDFPCSETAPVEGKHKDECDEKFVPLDPRSIRSEKLVDDSGYVHVNRYGCKIGKWDPEAQRCDGEMRLTQMLHSKDEPLADMKN